MSQKLQNKLAKQLSGLPTGPGIYIYKDAKDEIIYIGKAANLRNRVRQYFQKSRVRDVKTDALIAEIASLKVRQVETEADALFLEAELIRRYQPRYNIALRDDKSLLYVRIDLHSDYPTVSTVRRPFDDRARYFGPFLSGYAVKKALRYLRRAFPYATNRPVAIKRSGLHYHLGLDPGLEDGHTSLAEYRDNLRKLMKLLRGERTALTRTIETDMRRFAKAKNFEAAAAARNQLQAIQSLGQQILFGDKENIDLTLDEALAGLADLLGLKDPPRRIEAYDISHLGGQDVTGSMVVFSNGVPDKTAYRKFKMSSSKNDDYAHIYETIHRRLKETNVSKWGLPDLILIDGGRGQLSAATRARGEQGYESIPAIGLAKKFEEIIIKKPTTSQNLILQGGSLQNVYFKEAGDFITVTLPKTSPVIKLLQRIRDESHRFATSYRATLARTRQTTSLLDGIPGVGPKTRQKVIRRFGSVKAATSASEKALVDLLGKKQGRAIYIHLKQHGQDKNQRPELVQ